MVNDYELLYLATEQNEHAIELLYRKYKNFINYKVSKYCKTPDDFQDYLNIANFAFYTAIENYKDNNKFITFLNICIDRSLQKHVEKSNIKKNEILKNAIRLDENICYGDNKYNPEEILLHEENYKTLKNKILGILKPEEELVLLLKEQNYSLKEISLILDGDLKIIYRIIRKIKNKINMILKKQTT